MAPQDLPNYTDLPISTILQRQSIPCKTDHKKILVILERVFGNLKRFNPPGASNDYLTNRYRLFDNIDIIFEKEHVVLEVFQFFIFY